MVVNHLQVMGWSSKYFHRRKIHRTRPQFGFLPDTTRRNTRSMRRPNVCWPTPIAMLQNISGRPEHLEIGADVQKPRVAGLGRHHHRLGWRFPTKMLKLSDPKEQARWWFQIFFIFTPTWGKNPIWLIFFRWVETTNQTSQPDLTN